MSINNFPKSKELLKEHLLKNITHPEGTPEEVVKAVKEFVTGDERINAIIEKEPNTLFEFFDDQDLFCSVFKNKDKIGYRINNFIGYTQEFKTRKETEKQGVLDMFILLEEKL